MIKNEGIMKENITLVVGDSSHDGHNQTETVTITSNLTLKEIESAYKKATKKLKFNFTQEIASDFEDNNISKEHADTLLKHGIDIADLEDEDDDEDANGNKYYLLDVDSYVDTYLKIIKLGEPNFEYEITSDINQINIGGYGLFSL